MNLKIATAQYSIGEPADFASFAARVGDRVADAARAGADLVVLPEYLALEAAAALPDEIRADFARSPAPPLRFAARRRGVESTCIRP